MTNQNASFRFPCTTVQLIWLADKLNLKLEKPSEPHGALEKPDNEYTSAANEDESILLELGYGISCNSELHPNVINKTKELLAQIKKDKIYTIETEKDRFMSKRGVQILQFTGTIAELTEMFSYTLEIGNSWKSSIQRNPKTIKSLISNIQKSYDVKEGACYERTYIKLKYS